MIGPPLHDLQDRYRIQALEDENARLRAALAYYAKPRTFGKGEHSVFIDDSGVAKAVLDPMYPHTCAAGRNVPDGEVCGRAMPGCLACSP